MRRIPHGGFHATDFIHYIFICVNITIVPTYHRTPMAAYVQYVLFAWRGVSSSQQGGVKVDTGGCCCPYGRVLASQHPGVGVATIGCWRPDDRVLASQHPGLSHINTRVLRRKKGGVGTLSVYRLFSRGIFWENNRQRTIIYSPHI